MNEKAPGSNSGNVFEKRKPSKKINVIGADLTALTGFGNPNNTDWVNVFDTDPLYEQLRKSCVNDKEEPLDETDLEMADKGHTSYTFNDLEDLDKK